MGSGIEFPRLLEGGSLGGIGDLRQDRHTQVDRQAEMQTGTQVRERQGDRRAGAGGRVHGHTDGQTPAETNGHRHNREP